MKVSSVFRFILRVAALSIIPVITFSYNKGMKLISPMTSLVIFPVIFTYMHQNSGIERMAQQRLGSKIKYILWKAKEILRSNFIHVGSVVIVLVLYMMLNGMEINLKELAITTMAVFMLYVLFNVYVATTQIYSKSGLSVYLMILLFMVLSVISYITYNSFTELNPFGSIYSDFENTILFNATSDPMIGSFQSFIVSFFIWLLLILIYGVIKGRSSYD